MQTLMPMKHQTVIDNIVKRFVADLEASGKVQPAVVARLKKTLEDKTISHERLVQALFKPCAKKSWTRRRTPRSVQFTPALCSA